MCYAKWSKSVIWPRDPQMTTSEVTSGLDVIDPNHVDS